MAYVRKHERASAVVVEDSRLKLPTCSLSLSLILSVSLSTSSPSLSTANSTRSAQFLLLLFAHITLFYPHVPFRLLGEVALEEKNQSPLLYFLHLLDRISRLLLH